MTSRRLCLMVTSSLTATTFLGGYLGFLREDGWEVTLICSEGPGVTELVEAAGIAFAPLAMEREPSPLTDLRAVFAARKLLRRLRPDVLVYATPKASLVGALAGWSVRVPQRVYELWGLRLETAGGLSRRIFAGLESLTMRLSTLVIANSRSLAERAIELRLSGRRDVVVLGEGSSHGVDAARFSRDAEMPPIAPDLAMALAASFAPVIGFVGRLHPDKGIDTLLEALRLVADRGIQAQLLIVGSDEGAGFAEQLHTLGESVIVHTVGFARDPRPLMRSMDLLVLPSRREGFPNVVLEAAAMEVPAIVSSATGCVDAAVHGVTGIVVPVDDVDALAAAISDLVSDPERRARLGTAARQRVVESYVPEDVWAAHSDAWRS